MLAFPGAQGWGRFSRGGRGGRVIPITTLNPQGAGSLTEALLATGPRIIVPRVSGTIEFPGPQVFQLTVTNPFVTLMATGLQFKNLRLIINTHDVIARNGRSRVGPNAGTLKDQNCAARDNFSSGSAEGYNIIFDHWSFQFGVDENVGLGMGCHDITIQDSYIGWGLLASCHPEGSHSKGLMWAHTAGTHFSSIRNLMAHCADRMPQFAAPQGIGEQVNCVVYDYGVQFHFHNGVKGNVVGNKYIPGAQGTPPGGIFKEGQNPTGSLFYAVGNVGPSPVTPPTQYISQTPIFVSDVVPVDIETNWKDILLKAGAQPHDALDLRMMNDALNNTGAVINHPNDVGGWPVEPTLVIPVDTDLDGMPDAWELERGLNPSGPNPTSDTNGDGYDDVENCIYEVLDGVTFVPAPPPPPAPTGTFTAMPTTTPFGGGAVTLTWTSENAQNVSISGIGPVAPSGTMVVTITTTTGWTLSLSGAGGEVEYVATTTVPADTIPPTITITTPKEKATVKGIIPITVQVSDNWGVTRVDFAIDGVPLGFVLVSPYTIQWDTRKVKNGKHVIMATAMDKAGLTSNATVNVKTQNPGLAIQI